LWALTLIIDSQTDSSFANELLLPVTARRHYNRANDAIARAEYTTAVADFDSAIEIYLRLGEKEGRLSYTLGIAGCLTGRAHARRALGELKEAVQDYSHFVLICDLLNNPEDQPISVIRRAQCLVYRGSTSAALRDYANARRDFDQAIKIYRQLQKEPKNESCFYPMLADCMIRRGNAQRGLIALSESVRDYSKAVQLCGRIFESELQNKGDMLLARAYLNRSLARVMQGDFALAFLDLKDTVACATRHARSVLNQLNRED